MTICSNISKFTGMGAALIAASLAFGAPASAQTPSPSIERVSIPYALAYGACIYGEPENGIGTLPVCGTFREELLDEARLVVRRANPRNRPFALRSLSSLFDRMEAQAIELQRDQKSVGAEVRELMQCVSDAARSQSDFQSGIFVDGVNAFKQCEAIYQSYLGKERTSNAIQRNVNYMRNVRRLMSSNQFPFFTAQHIPREGLLTDRGPSD